MKILKKYAHLVIGFAFILSIAGLIDSCKSRTRDKPVLDCDTDCQSAPAPAGQKVRDIALDSIENRCTNDPELTISDCKSLALQKCAENPSLYGDLCQKVCSLDAYSYEYCANLAATCPTNLSRPYCQGYCTEKIKTEPEAIECKASSTAAEVEIVVEPGKESCALKYTAPENCKSFWAEYCNASAQATSEECVAFAAEVAAAAVVEDVVDNPVEEEPVQGGETAVACNTDVSAASCATERATICHATPTVTGCTKFFVDSCGTEGNAIANPSKYACSFGGNCRFRDGPSTAHTIYFESKSEGTGYKTKTDSGRTWKCVHVKDSDALNYKSDTVKENFKKSYVAWFCHSGC